MFNRKYIIVFEPPKHKFSHQIELHIIIQQIKFGKTLCDVKSMLLPWDKPSPVCEDPIGPASDR